MMVMPEQGMRRVPGEVVVIFRREAPQLVPADVPLGDGSRPGDQHVGQYGGRPAGSDQSRGS